MRPICNILIQELCDKNIEEFFGKYDIFFARSVTNEYYFWPDKKHVKFNIGFENRDYLNLDMNFFTKKNIIDISCGYSHCLALCSDGIVYGWGDNAFKRIDPQFEEKLITYAKIMKDCGEKISSIHCSLQKLFALTLTGRVFSYSDDNYMDWDVVGEK